MPRAALPSEPSCTNPFLDLTLSFIHAPVRLEKDSADGKPPFSLTLMRRLLLFNALVDNFDRGAAQVPGRSGAATAHRHIASAGCSGCQKNAVSALSNIVVISHRQNYNLFMQRLNLPMRIHAQRRLLRLTARGHARRNFTNQQ